MNPHSSRKTSLYAMAASAWRNRALIVQMTQREVLGRYRGSMIGLAWSFFNPLLMLGVYTFFFTTIFKSRWGAATEANQASFPVILFAGLIVQSLFAECINRAPTLIITNVNYVKKVVFPLEILPWISLGSALFHAAISLVVLLALDLILTGGLHWTILLLPIVVIPFIILTMGVAWFLAATGVFLRDTSQITAVITSVLLFVSPVFYPTSQVPEKIHGLFMFNPLTLIIENMRKVLLFGELPEWGPLAIYTVISLIVAWGGFWWFQKTRKGFADVL